MKRSHSFCGQLRFRLVEAGSSRFDADAKGLAPLLNCSNWQQSWAKWIRHSLPPNHNVMLTLPVLFIPCQTLL